MEIEPEKVELLGEYIPSLNEVITVIDDHKRFIGKNIFVRFKVPDEVDHQRVLDVKQIFVDIVNKQFLFWHDGDFIDITKMN
jgi:hypothetical protein